VDRWFASSKMCSACRWIDEELNLADRVFLCHDCGLVIERDLNASLNIRKEAIRLRSDVPGVASSARKFAGGAESSDLETGEPFCCEAGTTVS